MIMMKEWFCLDCNRSVELNMHGYCSKCGSSQVMPDRSENRILEQFPHAHKVEGYNEWTARLKQEAAALQEGE